MTLMCYNYTNETRLQVLATPAISVSSNLNRRLDNMNTVYNNPQKLTLKQALFVEEYLVTLNATQAAKKAGYKGNDNTLSQRGHELKNHPRLKKIIQRRIQNVDYTINAGEKSFKWTSPETARHAQGFVYLIQAENQLVKIGVSINPQKRFQTLNTASPIELSILFSIKSDDAYTLEDKLHKRFADRHIKGEWFSLSEEDIASVKKEYWND